MGAGGGGAWPAPGVASGPIPIPRRCWISCVAEVAGSLDLDVPGLERCERAVALLTEDPVRPIGDIAATLGVSHGHLDREFTRIVGLSPRRLARLLRVDRLLEAIDIDAGARGRTSPPTSAGRTSRT